ncbi:DUF5683 domain-containing protein [Cyclobacterium qasimii]|uniref:DUF5683 domain-containing protein n=1 Tax=Cyclobacterium qasimii M12-11B TaxID=641524 RepID=S7V772_9BACT|nr:DUF5683 domain-containing protein [Cyclobacterium qasimii]EPR65751.1 hypothetical protein ADICYQ_5238 [Cyclobacterium qasimii M12-11B]
MADQINIQAKLMRAVLGLLCLFLAHSALAQEQDSNDSLTDSLGNEAPTNVKDPKKALYLSLMFPGAGQVYNEKSLEITFTLQWCFSCGVFLEF